MVCSLPRTDAEEHAFHKFRKKVFMNTNIHAKFPCRQVLAHADLYAGLRSPGLGRKRPTKVHCPTIASSCHLRVFGGEARFFRSSSTPSTSSLSCVTSAMWSRNPRFSNSPLHSAWVSKTSSCRLLMIPKFVEVHEATSRRLRAVSPGCRSVLQRWQNFPDSANGGEPLIDALCQVERPIEAHRQHAPTRVHQRGFEERDPVKYPADDIELSSGEQRESKERVRPPQSLHPALRKQSFTSAVAANIVHVTLRKSGCVRFCSGRPSRPAARRMGDSK